MKINYTIYKYIFGIGLVLLFLFLGLEILTYQKTINNMLLDSLLFVICIVVYFCYKDIANKEKKIKNAICLYK